MKKLLHHFSVILILLSPVFVEAQILSNTIDTPAIRQLVLTGRSDRGTIVKTTGGRLTLLRKDKLTLRGEVRDQNGGLVKIVPLRVRESFFPDFDVDINYRDEVEIRTKQVSYYPTTVTIEADVGLAIQYVRLFINVVR